MTPKELRIVETAFGLYYIERLDKDGIWQDIAPDGSIATYGIRGTGSLRPFNNLSAAKTYAVKLCTPNKYHSLEDE